MTSFFKTDYIYDIETYPNFFSCGAIYANGKGERVYEISDRKDDTEELLTFLRNIKAGGYRLIGFSNEGFDYPVLHYILQKARKVKKSSGGKLKLTAAEIYKVAMDIITSTKDDRFGKKVKESEVILPQVDLFKVHHFDNPARATSLKMLEFNMRSPNIEELPFPVGTTLTPEQMDIVVKYNKNDIRETLKFYRFSYEALKLREDLTQQFGFDCTNLNDTRIARSFSFVVLRKRVRVAVTPRVSLVELLIKPSAKRSLLKIAYSLTSSSTDLSLRRCTSGSKNR